jgi:hypothetical protein
LQRRWQKKRTHKKFPDITLAKPSVDINELGAMTWAQ